MRLETNPAASDLSSPRLDDPTGTDEEPTLPLRPSAQVVSPPVLEARYPQGAVLPGAMAALPHRQEPLLRPAANTTVPPPRRWLRHLAVFLLVTLIGGAGGYLLVPRPGTLELSVQPPNALMALDGVPVAGGPILQLSRRAGVYRLTVSAPGYLPFDRSIQISARQFGHLNISLRPSPDTGFELTSSPSGAPVWLDGQPLSVSSDGKQALTNLHATGIAPGLHAIEIRESSKFQPWGEEFMQEPGRTVRLHANLLPLPRSEKVANLRSLVGNDERPTAGRERQKSSGGGTRSRQAPRESVPSSLEDAEDPFETMGGVP